MTATIIFCLCVMVITAFAALVYRHLWRRLSGLQVTPTGFGVFLPISLLAAAVVFHAPPTAKAAITVLSTATAIYWLDDVIGLSARIRMAISFATGTSICAILLSGDSHPFLLLAIFGRRQVV